MESITVRQRLRPIRYAFVIANGDEFSFLTATSVNSVLWGGLFNPILEVEPSEQREAIFKQFDPDYLVDLSGGLPQEVLKRFEHRVIAPKELVRDAGDDRLGRARRHLKVGFGMGSILRSIKNGELKGKTTSRAAMPRFEESNAAKWKLYAAAVFGTFAFLPSMPSGSNVSKFYSQLLFATDVVFDPEKDVDYGEWIFPITLTAYGLRQFGGFSLGRSSHIIYVGDRSSIGDLTEFWNLRATGRTVWFVPHDQYSSHSLMVRQVAGEGQYPINPEVKNRPDIQRGQHVPRDAFSEVLEWIKMLSLGPVLIHDTVDLNRITLRSLPPPPCELEGVAGDDRSFLDDGHMTPIKLVDPPFLSQDAVYGDDRWIVELAMTNPYRSDEWICHIPRVPGADDDLVRRQMAVGGSWGDTRLGNGGVLITADHPSETVYLSPVRAADVFQTLLRTVTGFEPSLSQPGRYAAQIIKKMGNLRYGCRILKVRGVREVINDLSGDATLTRGNMYDRVVNTTPDDFGQNWLPNLYSHLLDRKKGVEFSAIFDELLEKRVIRPGMRFTCANCNSRAWYHVSEFGEEFACRFCFERQRVPFGSKHEWQYKADGLFQVKNSAEGSVAAILALWRLDFTARTYGGIHSTGIDLSDAEGKRVAEIDYAFIAMDFASTAYELAIGEAKGFMPYEREKIASIAALADEFDPPPYIVLATLKDTFSDNEKQLIRDFAEKGYRMIPLTRFELDAYHLYDRFERAPHKYVNSLSDLSESTMFVNILSDGNGA